MWRSKHMSRGTKVEVNKRLVLPVLLYGCETRTLTAALRSRLDSYETKSLRWILRYRWFDLVSKYKLLEETSMTKISKLVLVLQMFMFGRVARLPPENQTHRVLSCGNPQGVGTDRVRAWTLAKEDAKACRRIGGTQPRHLLLRCKHPSK